MILWMPIIILNIKKLKIFAKKLERDNPIIKITLPKISKKAIGYNRIGLEINIDYLKKAYRTNEH